MGVCASNNSNHIKSPSKKGINPKVAPKKPTEGLPAQAQQKAAEIAKQKAVEIAQQKAAEIIPRKHVELEYKDSYDGSPFSSYDPDGEWYTPLPPAGPVGCYAQEDKYGAIADIANQLEVGDNHKNKPGPVPQVRDSIQSVVFLTPEAPNYYLVETARFYTLFINDLPIYTNQDWTCHKTRILSRKEHYYFYNPETKKITRTHFSCDNKEQDQELFYDAADAGFGSIASFENDCFDISPDGSFAVLCKEKPYGEPFFLILDETGGLDEVCELHADHKIKNVTQAKFLADCNMVAVNEDKRFITIIQAQTSGAIVLHSKLDLQVQANQEITGMCMCNEYHYMAVSVSEGDTANKIHILERSTHHTELTVISQLDISDKKHSVFGPMEFYGYTTNNEALALVCAERKPHFEVTGEDKLSLCTIGTVFESKEMEYIENCRLHLTVPSLTRNLTRVSDSLILTGYNYSVMLAMKYNV